MMKETANTVNTNNGRHSRTAPQGSAEVTLRKIGKAMVTAGHRQHEVAWGPVFHKWRETPTRAQLELKQTLVGIDIDGTYTRVGVWKNGTADVNEVTHRSRAFCGQRNREHHTWPLRVVTCKEGTRSF